MKKGFKFNYFDDFPHFGGAQEVLLAFKGRVGGALEVVRHGLLGQILEHGGLTERRAF